MLIHFGAIASETADVAGRTAANQLLAETYDS